jgi:UDP-N-acetylglucosamine acyltransferase
MTRYLGIADDKVNAGGKQSASIYKSGTHKVSNEIHSTAIVSPDAHLGRGNKIGPYAVIEKGVVLGDDNTIAAHAVLKTGTRMQNNNGIYEHAVLGGTPQHAGFKDESVETWLEIGCNNVFRESVTVNRAYQEGKSTVLGDNNFLMFAAHVGHDCVMGSHITIAPSSGIGGHVIIADRVFISGGVMVHQFVNIGEYAMIGGNSKITQDVLPYMITDGNPARVRGLNLVGLKRAGFKLTDIKLLKQAYRLIFSRGSVERNLAQLKALDHELAHHLYEFIQRSERSYHREK